MTPELLAEIKSELQGVTPGPWRWYSDNWLEGGKDGRADVLSIEATYSHYNGCQHNLDIAAANRAFIAAAPTYVAELVGEVERRDAAMKALISTYVERVVKPEPLPRWWNCTVPRLDGRTPQQALDSGDGVDVLKVALSYLNPTYS